ncbi:hypothetical protein [Dysgonomonas macrotermitis]|uniref:Uncharacterized protein n=1 Tax=Dysgonomonas macrotermitis TaxID=1346286 RepID=A0A1M5HGB6_9BACT|nr:hypothetical protein [Dysgonomonas macrotermitis]SHG14967.1 hypothetical protein SAMN05444362_11656 [Dysgonomonas macrotermitis]
METQALDYAFYFYYAICAIITLGGIITLAVAFAKEHKNLKIAGAIIVGTGIKIAILVFLWSLYVKFLSEFAY